MKKTTVAEVLLLSVLMCACAGQKHSQSDQSARAMQAVRDEVSRVVLDVERREELLATFDHYEEELRTFSRTVSALQSQLHTLNADPDASRVQFTDLLARYGAERKASRTRLAQLRYQVLVLTTDEEWRSIAKREEKALRLADPARAPQEAT